MKIYIVTEVYMEESQPVKAFKDIVAAKKYALESAESYQMNYYNANVGELPCYVESEFDRFAIEVSAIELIQ